MELNEWEKILDLKLAPVETKIDNIESRLARFSTMMYFVCGVIIVPLMFFILDKVF